MNTIERANDLLTKLNIIEEIKPNQKLNTNTLQLSNSGMRTSVLRTISSLINGSGTSRQDLQTWLRGVFEKSAKFIRENPPGSPHAKYSELIYDKSRVALVKLNNIKITYQEDTLFVASINTIIENAHIELENIPVKID